MSCPIDPDWEDKPQRVLLILETIDGQDLLEGRLLHHRSKTVVSNLIQYSMVQAKIEFGFRRKDCAWATLNFNNYKFFDQNVETWPGHRKRMAKRALEVIEDLKPTTVIVFGDWAMKALLRTEEFIEKKRGWVFDFQAGDWKCKITGTLDLYPLYSSRKEGDESEDDEDEAEGDVFGKANLLFYASRNILNALAGRNLYDLSHIKPKPRVIDTIDKFKSFYKKLLLAPIVAVDTETRNGSVNHNAIHTIQFAFGTARGYLIPIDHPQTPFSADEIAYIKKKLRAFFYAKPGKLPVKYLIMQYGIFDLRVLRVELRIPVIFHPVWEIMAGEWVLDENLKYLGGSPFNTSHGGLEQILMYYGNDYYKKATFGKGDRANPNLTRLDNPDFIKYGVMDVQSIFGIHEMQMERASHLQIEGKSFEPYFKRLVIKQFSNTVHVLSHMKQRGSSVDKEYLKLLKGADSPLLAILKKTKAEFLELKEVKEANRVLLKESSGQASNKGLFNKIQTIFKINKSDHKKTLFFGLMKLKPVSWSKKTKEPAVDKNFVKAYQDEHVVVKRFGEYQKVSKLYSTYVKGWWKVLSKNVDSLADFCLRPDYGFFPVVTGRLNSSKPSLQQVPARGDVAKYIKRMFIAPIGKLLIKFDYSAHEIRCWSYVSMDKILANAFRQGQTLRQEYRKNPTPETEKELKTKGDLHIWNAWLFFNRWIEKSDPLRDAIKQIVFGVIYGKSVKTLAKDLYKQKVSDLENKIRSEKDAAKKKDLQKQLSKLSLEAEEEMAGSIMEKLFKLFPKAGRWLHWSMDHAQENLYTYSPIGMRRNLFAFMTGVKSIVAAMRRRAANSPIQGWASQIGVTAARLIELELWDVLTKFGYIDKKTKELPADITKAIHDALHTESPYEIVLICTHVIQWTATYGVTEYYEREYGVQFTIEPEIEMEFGADESSMEKWNWSEKQFDEIIKKSLAKQKELGFLKNVDKAYAKIMSPYENKELKDYLQTRYPILGVLPDGSTLPGTTGREKALEKAKAK